MCTVEAPIHHNVKQEIVNAQETDTALVLRRWRNTSRLYANKVAKEAVRIEKESASGEFKDVAPYVSGKRGREVFINGDVDHGVWTAGQVIGLIHGSKTWLSIMSTTADTYPDIPTCDELVQRIEREAEETIDKASSLITRNSQSLSAGIVERNRNNPGAEIWGIGRSKL